MTLIEKLKLPIPLPNKENVFIVHPHGLVSMKWIEYNYLAHLIQQNRLVDFAIRLKSVHV